MMGRATGSPAPSPEPEEKTAVSPRLINKATNSTWHEVEPRLLKAIKYAARSSDDEVHAAAEALMVQMKKLHSQRRYLAVLIIDELFMRSKLFRSLLVLELDQFLSLSVGFRVKMPLPPPANIATKLRTKSIEILEKWNDSFGVHYRQLRLGFHYLKNTLGYQFPNRLENESRLQRERREREIRSKEIVLQKYNTFRDNYVSIKAEMHSVIDEIEECLHILHTKENEPESQIFVQEDDEAEEEFQSLGLRKIRLQSLNESEKVYESDKNKAIFNVLRELYKLLTSKYLPSVQDWISVLVRVDLSDNRFRDSALKEFIDIRNLISGSKGRCDRLGCNFDDEYDLWEEGKIEAEMPTAPHRDADHLIIGDSGSAISPDHNAEKSKGSGGGDDLEPASERSELLREAPVVAWGPHLETWGGSNRNALANQRGLEFDGHWGRVDPDATIPAEKIAELNVHRTIYRERQGEVQPCRAPLKKGGLCPRRDLRVCPFHGPIVLRDGEGKPIEPEPARSSPFEERTKKEEHTAFQLAKQALSNIRREDREKAAKRAKRAKVHEHNENVLREAALASASYSGGYTDQSRMFQEAPSFPNGKYPTQASMLRAKSTAKQRISARLLSSRASDTAARELTQAQDSL